MPDVQVQTLATALRACLCESVNLNPDPPEFCCYRIGSEIAHDIIHNIDICCKGLAYVSLGDIFPSSGAPPEADVRRQADTSCGPPAWIVQFQFGIIRCVPTEFEDPCTEWDRAFVQNTHDAQALRRTVCCFRSYIRSSTEFLGMSVIMDRQTQGQPQGGCVERKTLISVQMMNCDC